MTPLPKRKLSTRRQGRRRSTHFAKLGNLILCQNCKKLRLPHLVCPHCGFYKGRMVKPPKIKSRRKNKS